MQDLAYMGLLVLFFTLAVLFVHACDRIIGPDDVALAESGPAPRGDAVGGLLDSLSERGEAA